MIYDLVRYQLVDEKTSSLKRENVLLVSLGCSWGKCAFCDYQDDKASTVLESDAVNKKALAQVKGREVGSFTLEVTCSASYTELPFTTINYIREVCREKGIDTVILEGHYIFRDANPFFTDFFRQYGIKTIFRCGVETFDEHIREDILHKGLPGVTPEQIARHFSWINIMFGMEGQTTAQLEKDIATGLKYFDRVNLSIYTTVKNGPARDSAAIKTFYDSAFYRDLTQNPAIDIYDEWDDANEHKVGHDI
ncbi:hypothetical protein [Butyrivibrio sp. INlla21]|uniref:hypothetical protein n=1 Tax=Butyrivibrio sp. INlla21 TaxID=1520811 RepID=UPI0008E7271C|nr:hypothetical protein [Butyrivibrio sp. INlla21]SFU86121.1 hypothetical protein SAMN02910342_02092 [Butyrivibrio sp. INlla21]